MQFLADDALEGRDTGSPGHRKAAEYVAAAFKAAGLEPGGTIGFFQPIAFESRQFVEEQSRLVLVRDGREEPIAFGDAAIVNVRVLPAREIDAPLAFVGYGLSVPEAGYDDLDGLDLQGRIAVVWPADPRRSAALCSRTHRQCAGRPCSARARLALSRSCAPATSRGIASRLRRLAPVKALVDDSLGDTTGQQIALTVNPGTAEQWFAGSGHTAAELLALAAERQAAAAVRADRDGCGRRW